jgi:hypothetical protein
MGKGRGLLQLCMIGIISCPVSDNDIYACLNNLIIVTCWCLLYLNHDIGDTKLHLYSCNLKVCNTKDEINTGLSKQEVFMILQCVGR